MNHRRSEVSRPMRMLVYLGVILLAGAGAHAQVANPSFEEGQAAPAGWALSGAQGAWEALGHTGNHCVSVTGSGQDSNSWNLAGLLWQPDRLYRLSYWVRVAPGAADGCIVSGPSFCNRDFQAEQEWTQRSFVFVTPQDLANAYLRLGQWQKRGTVYFDDVSLVPVMAVFDQRKGIALGEGESIRDGTYRFTPDWGGEGANFSRPLEAFTAGFNSNRWPFGEGNVLQYRFAPGPEMTSGTVSAQTSYHQAGEAILEASKDGAAWTQLGRIAKEGEGSFDVPPELLPARELHVRIRSTGSFQITAFSFAAKLAQPPADFTGQTHFVEVLKSPADLDIQITSLGDLLPGPGRAVAATVANTSGRTASLVLSAHILGPAGEAAGPSTSLALQAGAKSEVSLPYEVAKAGPQELRIMAADAATKQEVFVARAPFNVPALYAADSGYLLPSQQPLGVWWIEATYKIARERAAPAERRSAVEIAAGRNEYEPFQLVLRPLVDVRDMTLTWTDLKGPGGAVIPAENVTARLVEYVHVDIPTDSLGAVGWYPDPLPDYEGPFPCPANQNTPVWFTVYVPPQAPAGDYEGRIHLGPAGSDFPDVAVKLHVWDFTLPKETHTRTAYGVGLDDEFLGLKTGEQRRAAFDMYLKDCARHRISPYDPMAYYPINWELKGPRWEAKSGHLRLVCDYYRGEFFDIYCDDTLLGSIHCTLTTFEKQGVGWEGTGAGWPSPEGIKEVRVNSKTDTECDVTIVAERKSSSEANRRFETAYRFTFKPGKPWFSSQLLYVTNTDTVPFRLDGYFHLLSPADTQGAAAQNGPCHGIWTMPGGSLGGTCGEEGAFTFGLQKRPDGACHGDISRPVGVWLQPGETFNQPQPQLFVVAWPAGARIHTDASGRPTINPEEPVAAGATIQYVESPEGTVTYDFTEFDLAASRYLDEFKFNGFNFPCLPDTLGGHARFTPEYNKLHKLVFGPMIKHLQGKGWLDEAYSYWFDEPTEEQYPYVIEGMKLLKESCPGLTRLLTEQPEPPLYGYVDLWVPVLSNYNAERCHQRQAAGDQVWWYVCCGPVAPYPNNFIDHPAINHRIRFWMMEKYGVAGSLYWSATYYRQAKGALRNPWESPMSISPDGGRWGNGDGMLLYPPVRKPSQEPVIKPPVDSIRWELLREGLEDREYMWILEQRIAKASPDARQRAQQALKQTVDSLVTSLTGYETDPQKLYAARRVLAQAIEHLGQ